MKYKANLRIDGSKVYSYNTHVATIDHTNRRLLIHGWHSVTTSKHVNHVADTYGLAKIKGDFLPEPKQDNSFLKTVSMVAAMGAVLCRPGKETNDFQSRILKAGLGNRGLIMPDNWNELPEEEKTRRLAGAIGSLKD